MTEDEANDIRARILEHVTAGKAGFKLAGTIMHIAPDGATRYLVWTRHPSAYLLPYESYVSATWKANPPVRYSQVPLDVVVAHIWTLENSDG